jgi:uncharacterized membrane protein
VDFAFRLTWAILDGVKIIAAVAAASLLLVPAQDAAAQRVHHFKNCTDMHKTYKGGVARRGAHDHRTGGGHARYAPKVSTVLYNANSKMDRDHDGIACEQ